MEIDFDEIHAKFSQRINELIEEQQGPKKLDGIYAKSGISLRQWSQLRNPKRPDWPNVKTLIRMCLALDLNPTWLLLGVGKRTLSVSQQNADHEQLKIVKRQRR